MPPDLNGSIPETLVENIENETSPASTQEDFLNRKRKSKPNKIQRKRMKLMREEKNNEPSNSTPDCPSAYQVPFSNAATEYPKH